MGNDRGNPHQHHWQGFRQNHGLSHKMGLRGLKWLLEVCAKRLTLRRHMIDPSQTTPLLHNN
jgi:hypothetical protein